MKLKRGLKSKNKRIAQSIFPYIIISIMVITSAMLASYDQFWLKNHLPETLLIDFFILSLNLMIASLGWKYSKTPPFRYIRIVYLVASLFTFLAILSGLSVLNVI